MIKKSSDKIVRKRKKILQKKKSKKPSFQWIFFLYLVLFCGGASYIFFFSSLADIISVEVQGAQRVDPIALENRALDVMDGKKFTFLKNRNFFLVDTKKIMNEILEDQRIKSVEIKKKFPHTMIVTIIEYNIVPVWCIERNGPLCFELEERGCLKREVDINAPLITENEHFIIMDYGHDEVAVGQCVITEDDLEKVQILGEELTYALDVSITQPYVSNARGSREMQYETSDGWHILIDLDHSVDDILYIARLFARKIELPGSWTDLEYIDLRFSGRIFYKMKGGEEEEGDASEVLEDPNRGSNTNLE